MESVGQVLKAARIQQNLTLDDVEKATSIRRGYIEAIENDNYENTPGEVFVKGIIRSYGNFLGLDGTALVNQYKANKTGKVVDEVKSEGIREVQNVELKISLKQHRNVGSGNGFSLKNINLPVKKIAAGIVAAVVIVGGYNVASNFGSFFSGTSENTATVNVKPEPVKQIPPVKNNEIVVEMTADDKCWLEVRADGKDIFAGMLYKNDNKVFKAKEKLIIKYGNIGVMHLIVNGEPVSTEGEKGVSVKTYTK